MCRVYLEADGGWAGEWGRRAWAVGDFFYLFIFCVCGWVGNHMLSPACSCHVSGPQNFNTFWQCVSWALPLVVHEGVTALLCVCMCMDGRTQHNSFLTFQLPCHPFLLQSPCSLSALCQVYWKSYYGIYTHLNTTAHIMHPCLPNTTLRRIRNIYVGLMRKLFPLSLSQTHTHTHIHAHTHFLS